MRKLLWIGDACCPSGFAKATHYTLETLRNYFEISVLGLNYLGDPHDYPYKVYPASGNPGRADMFGVRRVVDLVNEIKPDVVVIQNDPWNLPMYMKLIDCPTVAALAVDGKNCRGAGLNGLRGAIFWTDFGLQEARLGGYTGPAEVVPLGVDLNIFQPMDKKLARRIIGLPPQFADRFIVGNVNRNQLRKRLDLTIMYFAEWIQSTGADAYLFLHVAPTGDAGFDCAQLAEYFGVKNRLILVTPQVFKGFSEQHMNLTYNCFDVQLNTSTGEGWHLPTLEGMACGIPQVAGRWAAYTSWATEAAYLVPCTELVVTPNNINSIGAVPDREATVEALDKLYTSEDLRDSYQDRSLMLASRPEYDWKNIGEKFYQAIEKFLDRNLVLREMPSAEQVGV